LDRKHAEAVGEDWGLGQTDNTILTWNGLNPQPS
jgi:hypothetical protein